MHLDNEVVGWSCWYYNLRTDQQLSCEMVQLIPCDHCQQLPHLLHPPSSKRVTLHLVLYQPFFCSTIKKQRRDVVKELRTRDCKTNPAHATVAAFVWTYSVCAL